MTTKNPLGRTQALCGAVVLVLAACGGAVTSPSSDVGASIVPSVAPQVATIEFGTGYDATTLALTGKVREFPHTSTYIAWRVIFNRPLSSNRVDLVLSRPGPPAISYRWTVRVVNNGSMEWADGLDLLQWSNYSPGTYNLLVVSDEQVLAQGSFTALP